MTTGEARETYNESGLHPPVVSSKGLPQLHKHLIITLQQTHNKTLGEGARYNKHIIITYYITHTKHWVRGQGHN